MTSFLPDEPPGVLGRQEPRLCWYPPYTSSAGDEVIELAETAGLYLDPWQQFVLRHGMGERPDGRWSAFEVCLIVARQNGKGSILEALELANLFLFESVRLIVHSAHEFSTALEGFSRLVGLIEDTPVLSKHLPKKGGIVRSHGDEGINLKNGKRIRFRTRTSGGARGLTGDVLIFDEAMKIGKEMHASVLPLVSGRTMGNPGPQVWYTGSAVDEEVQGDNGWVLSRQRDRGLAEDPRLALFEWSVDPEQYYSDPTTPLRPEAWAQANPGLGIRISPGYVADTEQKSMSARKFAVERLSLGFWLNTDETTSGLFGREQWTDAGDSESTCSSLTTLAIDVTPERDRASIALAGKRSDGLWHVEVVENRPFTSWVMGRCRELRKAHSGARFVVGTGSPASSLLPELRADRIRVTECNRLEYVQGCGLFFDGIVDGSLRHKVSPALDGAVDAAERRASGDAFAWDRRSASDISPLVACTLALWGAKQKKNPQVINLNTVGGTR